MSGITRSKGATMSEFIPSPDATGQPQLPPRPGSPHPHIPPSGHTTSAASLPAPGVTCPDCESPQAPHPHSAEATPGEEGDLPHYARQRLCKRGRTDVAVFPAPSVDVGLRKPRSRVAFLWASILSVLALPPWMAFMKRACPRIAHKVPLSGAIYHPPGPVQAIDRDCAHFLMLC
jgi:hypothetical protein